MHHGNSLKKRKRLIQRAIRQSQTGVINRLQLEKKGLVASERFMNNSRVKLEDLEADLQARCSTYRGEHVLLIQDTSQYNFNWNRTRFQEDDKHIGVLGNDKDLGIHAHLGLAVDAHHGVPIGISRLYQYTIPVERRKVRQRDYQSEPIQSKFSYRWIETLKVSDQVLKGAKTISCIADREADIFQLFASSYSDRVKFIVRCCRTKRLNAQGIQLQKSLEGQSWQGQTIISVPPRSKRKPRQACLNVKWLNTSIRRPKKIVIDKNSYPDFIPINVVELQEENPPQGQAAIHWIILTTHEVTNLEQAIQISKWYAQRWWIEDFFRLTKTQGFELERSQFSNGLALKRLMFLVFEEALTVLTLRQGRKLNKIKAQTYFSFTEITLLKFLAQQLQGQTTYQQCPFPTESLAGASWIIARLGGWTPRNISKRPAGVITLLRGYRNFKNQIQGFELAMELLKKDP